MNEFNKMSLSNLRFVRPTFHKHLPQRLTPPQSGVLWNKNIDICYTFSSKICQHDILYMKYTQNPSKRLRYLEFRLQRFRAYSVNETNQSIGVNIHTRDKSYVHLLFVA